MIEWFGLATPRVILLRNLHGIFFWITAHVVHWHKLFGSRTTFLSAALLLEEY